MKITIEVSELNESTAEPWWMIINPRQSLRCCVHEINGMITGPFFSREEAQNELTSRRYAYGKYAHVYCASGCYTNQYRKACRDSKKDAADRARDDASDELAIRLLAKAELDRRNHAVEPAEKAEIEPSQFQIISPLRNFGTPEHPMAMNKINELVEWSNKLKRRLEAVERELK